LKVNSDKTGCECSVSKNPKTAGEDCTCKAGKFTSYGKDEKAVAYSEKCEDDCPDTDGAKNMWSAKDGLATCPVEMENSGMQMDQNCADCPADAKCDGTNVISCDKAAFAVKNDKKSCEEKCKTADNGEALTWSGAACVCASDKPLKAGSAGDTTCAACDPATNVTTGGD